MTKTHLITFVAVILALQAATAMATTYSISPNPATVSEGAGTLTFTITRSGGLPAETIYASTTQTEGYTNSGDYTGFANQNVVFTLNQTQKTVTVSITNDTTVENNETFGFIVQRNTTDPITTYLAKSTFTITDNDTLATTYSITPNPATVDEGVETLTFTITRSGGTPAETIYASTTTGEGYANSGDYTGISNQSVSFTSGQTTRTVTVSITNDSTVENNETFGFIVQRNTTDPITTYLAKSTFTITDNDTLPTTYSISPNPATVDEGVGTLTFTITRSGGLPAETIYASTTTGEGSANNGDYTGILNQTVSFTSGQTTRTVAVTITNDTTAENSETFGFIVQRNSGDPVTTYLAKSTFTITDNDSTINPPVSDGFDYPIGAKIRYTAASDGDGWYVAMGFNEYYSGNGKYHLGEDWNAESGGNTDYGSPIYAIANGTIIFAGPATVSGWGNVLIIRHKLPDGTLVESLYGHVASFLRTSGNVTRGEQVATIGDGGGLYSAHLHLEVRFSNCPYWGSEGVGYSVTPSPAGWTDPSDFIDAHRPTGTVPTVTVTTPNGGEAWGLGVAHTIAWSVSGDTSQINNFLVSYSLDGGTTYQNDVGTATAASRSISWTPPLVISPTAVGRIRVEARNASNSVLSQDVSDGTFTYGTGGGSANSAFTGTVDWIHNLYSYTDSQGHPVTGAIDAAHAESGGTVIDLSTLLDFIKSKGFQGIIIKAGEGMHLYPFSAPFSTSLVNSCHQKGLKIYGYHYIYGGAYDGAWGEYTTVAGEITIANQILAMGCDGLIIDWETEFRDVGGNQGAAPAQNALQYGQGIRAVYPNAFIAHAPIWNPNVNYPVIYQAFNTFCDVVMPQAYCAVGSTASYVANASGATMASNMNSAWQQVYAVWPSDAVKPICPVLWAVGKGDPNPTTFTTAAQISQFVDTLKGFSTPVSPGGYQGVSFWAAEFHTDYVWNGFASISIGNETPPEDTTPPTPIQSTWATAPYATGTASISMTAATASDPSGVQYFFHCLTAGGHDSSWQASATYQDTGLAADTTYTYQVKTRDNSSNQNQGIYSTSASATTQLVVQSPTVTGISPTSGSTAGGTTVTITGTNLAGATAVYFGTLAASSFTVNSAMQITATSPAGSASTVDVKVTTAVGTSQTSPADQFTYAGGGGGGGDTYYTLTVISSGVSSVSIGSSTGHGGITPYNKTVLAGTSVNLQTPQYVGSGASRMSFTGWSGSVTSSDQSIPFTMNDAKTVTANYTAPTGPAREIFAGPGGTHTMTTIGQTGGVDLTSQGPGSILNIVAGYDIFTFNNLGTATSQSAITTDVSSQSQVQFLGASNVYGDIGSGTLFFDNISAGAAGTTVNFLGNVFTTTMDVGTGAVNFNSGSTNVGFMYFTGDGTISLAPNTTVIGALVTTTANTGTLVLGGGSALNGAVGSMTGLKAINVVGDGVSATINGAVNAYSFSLRTNTLNIGGALTIATDGVINTTLASPTVYGHTVVMGASNLGTGLDVKVLVPSTAYIPVGTKFYIVQSTSGTGAPATVTVQSPTNPLYTFDVDTTDTAGNVTITTTSAPIIPMTGDLNMDGAVNFTDYATIANHWMETNCEEPNNWCEGTDFDHSGSVDMLDLATFAEYWLEGL